MSAHSWMSHYPVEMLVDASLSIYRLYSYSLHVPILVNKEKNVSVPWVWNQVIVNSKCLDMLQRVLVLSQLCNIYACKTFKTPVADIYSL